MTAIAERPRRNLFLPKVFLHDCLSLDLNDSGESEDIDEIDLLPMISEEDDSEEFVDDLVDNIITEELQSSSPVLKTKLCQNTEEEELPNLYGQINMISDMQYENTGSDYIEQYDVILKWFINVDTWPKSTNLDCWFCDCKNPGFPWFIPLTEQRKCVPCDPITGNITKSITTDVSDAALLNLNSNKRYREVEAMKTLGHFCSICCAKAYLSKINDQRIINKWQSNKLLKKLFRLVTGVTIGDIPEANPKTNMIQYCGPIDGVTSKEYRLSNEKRLEEYMNSKI